jgi:hypothetical protein
MTKPNFKKEGDDSMDIHEAAAYLGVSVTTLRRYVSRGLIERPGFAQRFTHDSNGQIVGRYEEVYIKGKLDKLKTSLKPRHRRVKSDEWPDIIDG